MNMDRSTAERWVTTAALIVFGVYVYRRFTESTSSGKPTAKQLVGVGPPAPLGSFATAWGFMFLVLSIIAEASPGVGGGLSILVATGDLLTNTPAITADIGKRIGSSSSSKTPTGPAGPAGLIPPQPPSSTSSSPTGPAGPAGLVGGTSSPTGPAGPAGLVGGTVIPPIFTVPPLQTGPAGPGGLLGGP